METNRTETLVSLAYILVANELGLTDKPLTEEDLTLLLLSNQVTMEEMSFLDELVQDVIEEVIKDNEG